MSSATRRVRQRSARHKFIDLVEEQAEATHQADVLLTQSISHLQSALQKLERGQEQPAKVCEYLAEAESRVEQLTRAVCSLMDISLLARRKSTQ